MPDLQSHNKLGLAGDGRCDSPGHSAKYGTYTLLQADSTQQRGVQKVVDVQLGQCTEVKVIILQWHNLYTGNTLRLISDVIDELN